MRSFPECYLCLERLLELAAELATSDHKLQEQARQAAREIIARDFGPRAIPAAIANRCHQIIQKITGNPDPFASRKKAETAYLAGMYRRLAASYGKDLESLLKLAVVGNAIDFFREEAEVTRDLLSPVSFAVSHLSRFQRELEKPPGLFLYLADNAGEQFFDLPLVMGLRRLGWRVVYVVKGGPIQNDLTRADLYGSGLGEDLEPVADTGTAAVGLDVAAASPAFQELFEQARLILAKGMGHFETLSHLDEARLFFLLQAKCGPVAQALEVPRRSFVLAQASSVSLETEAQQG
jgi:uncharacterized protein with ATP-grasp and redox domains